MHRSDLISLATLIVGISSSAASLAVPLNTFLPAHTTNIILGVLGAAGIIASQVIRVLSVPADTTQQAVAQAQVQAAQTASVTAKQVVAAQQNQS